MSRPVATVNPKGTKYKTLDEAAQAFCNKIAGPPHGWEHEQGGIIVQAPDGSYQLSTAVPGVHDALNFAAQFPKGYKLAGLVHSHPTTEHSGQYFSRTDMETAKQLGVPSYIQFDATNECRKYVPGVSKTVGVDDSADDVFHQSVQLAPGAELPTQQPVPTNNTTPLVASK